MPAGASDADLDAFPQATDAHSGLVFIPHLRGADTQLQDSCLLLRIELFDVFKSLGPRSLSVIAPRPSSMFA